MNPLMAFLSMLRDDIIKYASQKAGVSGDSKLLTGQTITEDEIKSLPAYKLMTPEERQVVYSILASMTKSAPIQVIEQNKVAESTTNGSVLNNSDSKGESGQGLTQEKVLLKQMPGVIPFPREIEQDKVIDYKDAA